MSEKLKTLKDLKIPEFKWEYIDREKLCSRIELKREAIKWIKELERKEQLAKWFLKKHKNNIDKVKRGYMYKESMVECLNFLVINWIKYFFNISDEDLKEEDMNEVSLKRGFVHVIINLDVFTAFIKNKTIHYEVLNPLPKDAQLIHFEYDNELKEIHLYFTSEKGYPLKEGQVLSTIPVTDIRLKEVKENE